MENNMKRVFKAADELDELHQTLNKVKSIMALTFNQITESSRGEYYTITQNHVDALDHVGDQLAELTAAIGDRIITIQDICQEDPANA